MADVYKQIIADFKSAETNLLPAKDPKAGEVGRVNRSVAKGFLAKATRGNEKPASVPCREDCATRRLHRPRTLQNSRIPAASFRSGIRSDPGCRWS